MLFNSYDFLFIFLPIVTLIYYLCPKQWNNSILGIASYIFYAYWDYRFCSLLLISTVWDYYIGKLIFISPDATRRKILLLLSLLLNSGMLGYFKYLNFFIESLMIIFPDLPMKGVEVVLPIGISFYTFQSMSYSIDIFRNKAKPVEKFTDFACYISMFPQLVAGPVVRYNQIESQLANRNHSVDKFAWGIRRFIQGLAKKVIIADSMALIADSLFKTSNPGLYTAWTGTVAFSLQIYFDFSGYSDMAIGLGRMFGFELPENFNFPYKARGISDFWRRWHMSLSGWLRDYLYIPLGGSRKPAQRVSLNLMITMLLCGLWHGASWTFVIWGGYYGFFLILERPFRKIIYEKIPPWMAILYTYPIIIFGWVIFRAESVSQMGVWLKAMLGITSADTLTSAPVIPQPSFLIAMIIVQLSCWIMPSIEDTEKQAFASKDIGFVTLFIICILIIMSADNSPFLYYQF